MPDKVFLKTDMISNVSHPRSSKEASYSKNLDISNFTGYITYSTEID